MHLVDSLAACDPGSANATFSWDFESLVGGVCPKWIFFVYLISLTGEYSLKTIK